MGLGWKSACKEGSKRRRFGSYNNFAQVDTCNLCLLWLAKMQCIARTETQINSEKCRLQKQSLVSSNTSFFLHTDTSPSFLLQLLLAFCLSPSSPLCRSSACLCPRIVVSICLSSCLSLSNTDPGARACGVKIKC